eukprot:9375550-Pyramimonas_sp.AAC.1
MRQYSKCLAASRVPCVDFNNLLHMPGSRSSLGSPMKLLSLTLARPPRQCPGPRSATAMEYHRSWASKRRGGCTC